MVKYTAIIQNYGATRQKNWPAILKGLADYPPERLIIWDNSDSLDLFGGWVPVHIIRSSVNHLLGYVAAAVLAETELIYKQDNDIALPGDSIRQLIERASESPAIVTPLGNNLGADPERPYTRGTAARAPGPCDIVIGRVWACQRRALVGGLTWILENGNPDHANDIVFSLTSTGGCTYLPVPYTNLDEGGIGLCLGAGHFPQRDAMAARLRPGGRPTSGLPVTRLEDLEVRLRAANDFILEQEEQIARLKIELEVAARGAPR